MEKEEVTEGEIQLCYQLGGVGQHCATNAERNLLKGPDAPESDVEVLYSEFREIAQRFNIVLPEQLPKGYSDQYKTVSKQLLDVCVHFQDKNKHLRIALRSGILLESLQYLIFTFKFVNVGEKMKQGLAKLMERITDELQLLAEEKGVDISEELGTVANRETEFVEFIDIRRLIMKLKMKLCSLATNEPMTSTKRSAIDSTRMISDDYWVISLVRLPDRGNSEHAFLVLEAKTGTTLKIWFIDFVARKETDLFLPGIRDGRVRIKIIQAEGTAASSSELLFQCQEKLMNVRPNERLLHSSWPISKSNAEVFLENVEAQREKPPKYNILGNSKASAVPSCDDAGHNCFTFARKMLHDLKDPYVKLPADELKEWVYSATSRFLRDPILERHKWQMTRFPVVFAFLVGLAVCYIILKVLP